MNKRDRDRRPYKTKDITPHALVPLPPEHDDDNDDWDDDPLDSIFPSEAEELADVREARAWEVFLCLVESTAGASCLPTLGRPRTPGKVPVMDWRALARSAYDAADTFADIAQPEHDEHVRTTKRDGDRR